MMHLGGWGELLMLSELDVNEAIKAAKKTGGY